MSTSEHVSLCPMYHSGYLIDITKHLEALFIASVSRSTYHNNPASWKMQQLRMVTYHTQSEILVLLTNSICLLARVTMHV